MELTHRIASYYKYITKGKSGFYLHSPFLYYFKTNILSNAGNSGNYSIPEQILNNYSGNNKQLLLDGMGAKNNTRGRVKDIAAGYSLNKKYGRMLSRLVTGFDAKNIIELGTALGISTAYLAVGKGMPIVTTFEGEPRLAELARNAHVQYGLNNIKYITGNIDDTLPAFLTGYSMFDLAFVDANHTYHATMNYFRWLLPHSHSKSIIVFDDIHWSREMSAAWSEIIKHETVTLSIDLYRMGIIFFNPSLSKENFKVWF